VSDIVNDSALIFDRSDALTYAGVIDGTGTLTKEGAGILTLTAANTFAGLTTINTGTLQLGDGGTAGSIVSDIVNDSALIFNRSDALTYGGTIDGTGTVTVRGGGTTIFTANNTYTGSTQIFDATLQLGNGGTTGAIAGNVEFVAGQGGTLAFNHSNTLTYGGTIFGDGSIVKLGSGTTVLTGDSPGFTGMITVNTGILVVDASMTNSVVMVNGGGAIRGTGELDALIVLTGGIVEPGESIGALKVKSNFTIEPGAVYVVEANAAGEADKVIVTGTVNLTGSTLQVLAENGDYDPRTEYVIVENDGTDAVNGEFGEITTNLAFLTPVVFYDGGTGNDVVMILLNDNNFSFCSEAVTRNQCNVAHALDQFSTDDPLFLAVLNQTAEGARQAFDALSGEIHTTLPGILADDSRYVREAVLGRLTQAAYTNTDGRVAALGSGGPQVASLNTGIYAQAMALGYEAPPPSSGAAFWTRGYGAWGDFEGDGNAASADRDLGGFISGIDTQISGTWRAGLAAGGSWSNVSVGDRHSHAEVESFQLAGYAGGMAGPLTLRGGGAWAWQDIDTDRAVMFPGFFERQSTSYDADTGQIFGEVAYPMASGRIAFEPFAGLAYVSIETDSFRERGGALSSLTGRGGDEDVGYSTLGLRAATVMQLANATIVPKISAAWQHAFDDVTPGASLAFATTGIGFGIDGVPLAQDSLLLEAGLDFSISATATLGVSYSGQFASDVTDNAVKGRLTWLF
jgi:outer membrane autotransporter protein